MQTARIKVFGDLVDVVWDVTEQPADPFHLFPKLHCDFVCDGDLLAEKKFADILRTGQPGRFRIFLTSSSSTSVRRTVMMCWWVSSFSFLALPYLFSPLTLFNLPQAAITGTVTGAVKHRAAATVLNGSQIAQFSDYASAEGMGNRNSHQVCRNREPRQWFLYYRAYLAFSTIPPHLSVFSDPICKAIQKKILDVFTFTSSHNIIKARN